MRWRPVRAGVVNVWRYLEETFEFHRGRLLLRGPNGSGKSMALELLLPFLLDADARPWKLSSATRSRGGLYERLMAGSEGSTRAGFLWAQFACEGRTFTIGARIRGSENTHRATTDWFTTTQVVGRTLHLLDEHRTPLSREALRGAIAEHGTLHEGVESYRETVRTTLYPGLTAAQYEAMVVALHALRREKISQDLTPQKLSETLTASLPPLDEHDITEVAEGFEKLDRRKENLAKLEADIEHVRRLAGRQRAYARIVLAAAAADVRSAETRRDDVTRREREAKQALSEAGEQRETLDAERTSCDRTVRDRTSEIEALRASDIYKEGGALEQLRQELDRLVREAGRARAERDDRETDLTEARDAHAAAADARTDAEANEALARTDVDARATAVSASGVVTQAGGSGPDDAERLLAAWTENRQAQLREVRRAARTLADVIAHRDRLEEQADADREAVDRQAAAVEDAARALDDARDAYRSSLHEWSSSCAVLSAPDPLPDEPAAVAEAVSAAAGGVRAALAVERERIAAGVRPLEERRGVLEEERDELASGRTPEPDVPSWRTPRDRGGAPFWRLVDFADGCDRSTRDGVEAALLASGMLDAWVSPGGTVTLPDGAADVLLDARAPAVDGPSLADVLTGDTTVRRICASIAFEPHAVSPVSVGADGSFRLGTLSGRGAVTSASFIGAAAQERRRAERIAAIEAELRVIAAELDSLMSRLRDVDRREALLDAEIAALPDGAPVDTAVRALQITEAVAADAEARLAATLSKLEDAGARVKAAQAALMRLAAEHALPTGEDELDAFASALEDLRGACDAWLRRRRDAVRAARELEGAQARVAKAAERLRAAVARVTEAEREEHDVSARLSALERHVGAEYREIVARIEQADGERRDAGSRRDELDGILRELERRIGKLTADVEDASQRRVEADEHRERQRTRFVAALADGFGSDAGVELGTPETMTAVVDAARIVAQQVQGPCDDRARDQAQTRLNETLHDVRTALAAQVDITFEQADQGWWLLRAATDGIRRSVGQLQGAFKTELDEARAELRDEERKLFDETLTGSVRMAVAERIRRCTELVKRINGQLEPVSTAAAGLKVRLRWEVDPEQPDAVRSARALLLKDPADLTDGEREALYAFFRARLDHVHAELDGSAGWETRLREVLDYRTWHRFSLEIAHREHDGFVPATAARLQKLSTGERSMALHLPMLASITAHYEGSACPRLILLDELFAGVDTSNRAQLFGMFRTWDLDAVLTSDHEWCAYATLDGIAIHHLHPADGDDPVTSTRFVWDGRRRVATPVA